MVSICANTILLIDDNPDDLYINRLVIKDSGVAQDVLEFEYAQDALEFLEQHRDVQIDLILLDINMHPMSGFEFLKQFESLRRPQENKPIVIMLTNSSAEADVRHAQQCQDVKGYATKPLTMNKIEEIADKFFPA